MSTRGMQYIINNASGIEVSRAKTVGQLVVRSGRIRTAERASEVPWQMIVSPPGASRYEQVRDVIEGITLTDRNRIFYIDFNSTAGLNYVADYQGDLTTAQQAALRTSTATSFLGAASFDVSQPLNYIGESSTSTFDYIRITNLPAIGSTGTNGLITGTSVLFAPGDWLQFSTEQIVQGTDYTSGNYRQALGQAYTVPLQVLRGTGTFVDVPVHRPLNFYGNDSYTSNKRRGCEINIGKEVRMRFILTKMPSWKLLPGKIVQWNGDFELFEWVE